MKCHDEAKGQRGCSETPARREHTSVRNSCIACHMPHYSNSDVVHAAATDHRILRRPADHPPGPTTDGDDARFVNFYSDRFPEGDPQAERTRGLGLLKLFVAGKLSPQQYGQQALASLESALGSDSRDFEVREGKVQLLSLLGQPSQALTESQEALAARPGDWRLLALAASAAEATGQTDLAIDYGRRAVEINPFEPETQVSLVDLLVRTGRRDEAQTRMRDAVAARSVQRAGTTGIDRRPTRAGQDCGGAAQIRRHPPPPTAGSPATGGMVSQQNEGAIRICS